MKHLGWLCVFLTLMACQKIKEKEVVKKERRPGRLEKTRSMVEPSVGLLRFDGLVTVFTSCSRLRSFDMSKRWVRWDEARFGWLKSTLKSPMTRHLL